MAKDKVCQGHCFSNAHPVESTPLSTSNRLGSKGSESHEVNRRAVLASHQYDHA